MIDENDRECDCAPLVNGRCRCDPDYERAGASELVLAIAHEVGNLAAAVQLHAYLIEDSLPWAELKEEKVAIERLTAQQGVWLGLLRPLLDSPKGEHKVSPRQCLLAVADALLELGYGAQVEVSAVADLPTVDVSPQLLHQLVLLLASGSAIASKGHIQLSAHANGGSVTLTIADDGSEDVTLVDWRHHRYAGRVLCCAVVDHFTSLLGGTIAVEYQGGWTRFALALRSEASIRRDSRRDCRVLDIAGRGMPA